MLGLGRLGVVVKLEKQDAREREEILRVHTRPLPLSETVDHAALAELTDGMNGADLASLIQSATFERMQDFISDHGDEADARAGEFSMSQEDFLRALNAGSTDA